MRLLLGAAPAVAAARRGIVTRIGFRRLAAIAIEPAHGDVRDGDGHDIRANTTCGDVGAFRQEDATGITEYAAGTGERIPELVRRDELARRLVERVARAGVSAVILDPA